MRSGLWFGILVAALGCSRKEPERIVCSHSVAESQDRTPATRRILAELHRVKPNLSVREIPLKEFLPMLEHCTGIPFRLLPESPGEAKISICISELKLITVLDLVFRAQDIRYTVSEGVVWVASLR